MPGWNHDNANWRPKFCVVCGEEFKPRSGVHKFCSKKCKWRWPYITGKASTEHQYKKISGSWERYTARLVQKGRRKKDGLTREAILRKMEEQNYLCALSGVPLTCSLEKGKPSPTNASVDRIEAGGSYAEDNIQIVCIAVNKWRSDLTVDEFVGWCRLIADNYDGVGYGRKKAS